MKRVCVYHQLTLKGTGISPKGPGAVTYSVLFQTQNIFLIPLNQAPGQKFPAPVQNVFLFFTGLSVDRNLLVTSGAKGRSRGEVDRREDRRRALKIAFPLWEPEWVSEEPETLGVAQWVRLELIITGQGFS